MRQEKIKKGFTFLLALALILGAYVIAMPPEKAGAYNWPWDQGHDCVNTVNPDGTWGRYDYNGVFHGNYSSKECCQLLCKVCPIYANTGRLQESFTDLSVPGVGPALNITRTYNSQDLSTSLLGHSWIFNFGRRLIIGRKKTGEKVIGVLQETGEKNFFQENLDGTLTLLAGYGVTYTLSKKTGSTYMIKEINGIIYELNADGKIFRIVDGNDNALTFTYNAVGCLTKITNASGNFVSIQLGANGKIASISDNLGRTVNYGYNQNGDLASFQDTLGNTTQYAYDNNHRLTKITNPRGNVVLTAVYNSDNKVSSFTEKGETYTITYYSGYTQKKDSKGNTWTYNYNNVGVIEKVVDPFGNVTEQAPNKVTSTSVDWKEDANGNRTTYAYDAHGNVTSETDPLGDTATYTYIAGTNFIATGTDPLGRVTKFEYDAKGNNTRIISDFQGPLENTTLYTYDSQGNLLTETDPLGRTTRYTYDSMGNMIEVTDPAGYKTQYVYNNMGNKIREIDSSGHQTSFEYDLMGRNTKVTNSLGQSRTYTYDGAGNLSSMTDFKANVCTMEYDQYNRRIKTVDPDGGIWATTYLSNNIEQISDPCGRLTFNYYDINGRLKKSIQKVGDTNPVEDADDLVWEYTYDANGNKLTDKDAMENVTTYAYNAVNQVTSVTNPEGEVISYLYNHDGSLKSGTYPNGNLVQYEYDSLGRKTKEYDSLGTMLTMTYDILSRVQTITDGNNNTTTFTYDQSGNVINEADPLGNKTSYTYDAVGNLASLTDREGNTTQFFYNADDQLISVTDALGNSKEYTYDENGNQIAIKDANGNITGYEFDAMNRLVKRIYADNTSLDYTYDCFGNLETTKDQQGQITTYMYDAIYRKTKIDYPGTNDSIFTYDKLNRVLTAKNDSSTIGFQYDKVDRITGSTQFGQTVGYSYNIAGKTRMLSYPSGKVIAGVYDARGRLTAIRNGQGTDIATYSYDNRNLLTTKQLGNVFSSSYTFNQNNWLSNLVYQRNNSIELGFEYGFDKEGHRTYKKTVHELNKSGTYKYDGLYRLIEFKQGLLAADNNILNPNELVNFVYDGVDNRLSISENGNLKTYLPTATNGYSTVNGISYTYDKKGNLLDDNQKVYVYGPNNELLSITDKAAGTLLAIYQYDALGRRCKKTVGGTTTEYIFDGDTSEILAEVQNSTISAEYIYGAGLNELVSVSKNGTDYLFLSDVSGSIIQVMDNNGNILESYSYDPYGKTAIYDGAGNQLAQSAIDNSLGYIGQRYQPETGLYEFHARLYDPKNGRFLSFDPIGYAGGLNLYHYAGNDPINSYDPTGLFTATVSINPKYENKTVSGALGISKYSLADVTKASISLKSEKTGRQCCRDGTVVCKGEAKEKKYSIKNLALNVTIPTWVDENAHKKDAAGNVWWIQCDKTKRQADGYFPLAHQATKPAGSGWRKMTVSRTKKHEMVHSKAQAKMHIVNYFKNINSPEKTWCPDDTANAKKKIDDWKKELEKNYGDDALIQSVLLNGYGADTTKYESAADDAACGF